MQSPQADADWKSTKKSCQLLEMFMFLKTTIVQYDSKGDTAHKETYLKPHVTFWLYTYFSLLF